MAQYYLISQLPSLDGINENTPLPINEARFLELCNSLLNKKMLAQIESLTLLPHKNVDLSDNGLIKMWNEGERELRIVLARLRAEKMHKSFDSENRSYSPELLQTARSAIEIESPMEAEKFLNRYRLAFLETIRPSDSFSDDFILYYGLKLKLLERMREFDMQSGKSAYDKIYDSIMNENRTEVI